MAKLIPNSFSTYQLTEDEVREGTKLTITQKQVIQVQRSAVAEELLALKMDTNSPNAFIQEQAFKQGYLAALDFTLESSAAMEELELLENNS